jgi:phosphatidylserine/phosphatidylglycerophosphate/cardiolipin synthase-like enzyme
VIDERLVIAGSFNYTGPADTLNDENILVFGNLEETNPAAEPRNDNWLPTRWPRSSASSPMCANQSEASRNRLMCPIRPSMCATSAYELKLFR